MGKRTECSPESWPHACQLTSELPTAELHFRLLSLHTDMPTQQIASRSTAMDWARPSMHRLCTGPSTTSQLGDAALKEAVSIAAELAGDLAISPAPTVHIYTV
jgi:hypothetical protein